MAVVNVTKFYKGFNTSNYEETGKHFAVYNLECVENDLMNEIFTVRGQRLYMPNFGTRIPILTFEMLDDVTADVLKTDLTQVFSNDPRVDLQNLQILQASDRNALIAIATINYKEFQVTKDLRIEVNSQ